MINDYTKFDSDYMFQVPTHVYIYIYMPSYVSGIDALIDYIPNKRFLLPYDRLIMILYV